MTRQFLANLGGKVSEKPSYFSPRIKDRVILAHLARTVRELRQARGWSVAQLHRRCLSVASSPAERLCESSVLRAEGGKMSVALSTVEVLARALEVDAARLTEGQA